MHQKIWYEGFVCCLCCYHHCSWFYICIYFWQILMQANCAVCKVDISGATALGSAAASSDLYGTQSIGLYGKICSWKAVLRTLYLLQLNNSQTKAYYYILLA